MTRKAYLSNVVRWKVANLTKDDSRRRKVVDIICRTESRFHVLPKRWLPERTFKGCAINTVVSVHKVRLEAPTLLAEVLTILYKQPFNFFGKIWSR